MLPDNPRSECSTTFSSCLNTAFYNKPDSIGVINSTYSGFLIEI